ncbi:aldo/keto reductase [Couchioplanes caeruleus]|uniref:Aldo/keto reductase n=2 Tax=Couchioplanes caeruleus TaxID=56438 RepID=A0A1K0FLJ6_9ACTN|nr:aldo/keto reductase [Couchioplanes caeruleus]OJF13719.1 aldo/keto reductase [Couchioplanes caeruleus subsp. caeruleus]ROP32463.1 aryl-alcohol dehydrogenase-like predicted oxidoreductase [Couchioplanes caeruleus]
MTVTVPTVALGDGLHVSRIGFGGMALSHAYGDTDPDEALRTLHHAVDQGVAFIDTADVYGRPRDGSTGPAGTNEELIARLLADRRDEVSLATKFGITGAVGTPGIKATRGDRDYVRSACEASLRRLGTDVIDLYYLHRRQLDIPIEETVGAMAELVAEGKVRHLGLSEVTADELRAAARVHPIAAVQSEWSLWSRDVEARVVPAAREVGAGFVPYSPLGRGFLTGAMTPEKVSAGILRGEPRFVEHFAANQRIVDLVREVGRETGATAAQVALAWLWARGEALGLPVVPIPGTRVAARVTENAGALRVRLSPAQKARLDSAADLVQGGRNLSFAPKDWISAGRE